MKSFPLKNIFIGATLALALTTAAIAASGTIDPAGTGQYKAAFLDSSLMTDTSINFGKFTTQSQYNITISDTELRGYAWGSSVGYIVTNCVNTSSGCTAANGNFKIANNAGVLSGYAWGENTGWINFGPFTNGSISTVKIGTNGNFGGTSGPAGYAWSQNYGWIVFDCASAATCVHTNWVMDTNGGTSGGGGAGGAPGTPGTPTTPPPNPTTPPPETPPQPTPPTTPPADQPPANNLPGDMQEPTTPPTDTPTDTPTPGIFDKGLQLPPGFLESIGTISNTIVGALGTATKVITDIGKTLAPAATKVLNVVRSPEGEKTAQVATAVSAGATLVGTVAVVALANPISIVDLILLPLRLWTLLLVIFGFKKRRHPWGTVYDSVTKQPIDPAYVMLTDLDGNEVATSITDIDGRYGFYVSPGTYRIIANKTNFEFPSKKLADKTEDELYGALYLGDVITIKEEGEVITKNIPMDQLNFDWNEFAKTEQKRLSYYKKTDVLIARISTIFFGLGFSIAAISLIARNNIYNSIVFVVYLVMFLIRQYSPAYKAKGSITDAITGQPLPFAIIHVLSLATGQEITHKVADRLGNYYCLVPNGTYSVTVDKKNADATYTKVATPQPITVKKGYLQESFKV
ncbi:MAG: hypothetical protein JWL92_70 [Candidatus Nomurabacteria bacterium]|nr:hypothetical protein [Candidatus Nomurabacteria bacterium]